MEETELKLQGRLYLIRHGEYIQRGINRLTDDGKKVLRNLADKIKTELNGTNPWDISFFSSEYPRAVESAVEFVDVLGWDNSRIVSSPLLSDSSDCESFFKDNLSKLPAKRVVFALGHMPFVEAFPLWFFKNIHRKEGDFYSRFGQRTATGIYIDLKTGEHREISLAAYERLAQEKLEEERKAKERLEQERRDNERRLQEKAKGSTEIQFPASASVERDSDADLPL